MFKTQTVLCLQGFHRPILYLATLSKTQCLNTDFRKFQNQNIRKIELRILFLRFTISAAMDLIRKYFPDLLPEQYEKFSQLESLYLEWNSRINVISRKDMENFYEHHVLHSLGIAKVLQFRPGAYVLDVGTGGGFPGIPLAIMFPETNFVLVDSIGKKIKVVNEVTRSAGITNVKTNHCRAEDVKEKFDFVVSRAVTTLPEFMKWVANSLKEESHHSIHNGILYLKGGELEVELALLKKKYQVFELSDYFEEAFFETKKVVHIG
jgi:16S rRNA (guanine527-N7)-methyltransferase